MSDRNEIIRQIESMSTAGRPAIVRAVRAAEIGGWLNWATDHAIPARDLANRIIDGNNFTRKENHGTDSPQRHVGRQ